MMSFQFADQRDRPEPTVRLRYGDQFAEVRTGERLLDALLDAGMDHRHICGGNGFCTSCRVEVLDGSANLSPVNALERSRLGPRAGSLRLACQTIVRGSAWVRVPIAAPSRFSPDGE